MNKGIQSSISGNIGSLGTAMGNRFDSLDGAVGSLSQSASDAIRTVDTVVDGIAEKLGTPAGAQETVFKEFDQLKKGGSLADGKMMCELVKTDRSLVN